MYPNRILIISPSGKLYGSENVLFDYLTNTNLLPCVLVPARSDLHKKLLHAKGNYTLNTYNPANVPWLYLKLFFSLFLGRYTSVYINEAGHVRYILLLAKFWKNLLFTVHVRMREDTAINRWNGLKGQLPNNIKIIAISDYLSKLLAFPNYTIYDPFIFNVHSGNVSYTIGKVFNIGVIGRVTVTKGINLLTLIVQEMKSHYPDYNVKFHLYGEISDDLPGSMISDLQSNPNIMMHGYVKGPGAIYTELHAVMHLSRVEALGRIFFEAVDYGLPFIGIKAAGIGEIAKRFEYKDLMIANGADDAVAKEAADVLVRLIKNYSKYQSSIDRLKNSMKAQLTITNYCNQIDNLIASSHQS